jgi:type IV secretion system protein VirB4
MKTLSLDEQVEVDQAILSVLRLDKKLHSISSLVHHCSASVKEKFSRFTSGGLYGHVFDSEKDAIGSSHKSVVGYNLAAFKEDKVVLPYIMYEIFYRIISVFDSPEFLGVPKYADFDEAQVFFSIPGCAKMISSYVRTGGKKMSGISLTTQSPRELIEMDDWPMLRSASSTFIFMADPAMDIDLYKKAFHLTDAEVNHISNLKPRAEAYIVQREINVSKTILVDVEPEQEVISTSKPKERIIRENNIKKYGFEEGVDRTVRDLGFSTTS